MAWISSFPLMPADSSWFTLAEDQPGRIQSTASLLGVGLSQSQPLVCSLQLLPLRAQLPGMSTELYQGTGLLCSEVDKVPGSDLLPGAGSSSMSRLLVERRIPIYQLCHAGLKGGHPWLTLLQSSGTWRVRISAFTSKVPCLPQNSPNSSWLRIHWLKEGFTEKGKRDVSHPEQNHLGRSGCSWECEPAPAALSSCHTQCVTLHLLCSHPGAALLQEGAAHSHFNPLTFHSFHYPSKLHKNQTKSK